MCDVKIEVTLPNGSTETLHCIYDGDLTDDSHGESHKASVFW